MQINYRLTISFQGAQGYLMELLDNDSTVCSKRYFAAYEYSSKLEAILDEMNRSLIQLLPDFAYRQSDNVKSFIVVTDLRRNLQKEGTLTCMNCGSKSVASL